VCLQVLHAAASAANFLGGGDFRGSTLLIVLDVSLLSLEGYVSRTNPWDQQTLIGYCGKPVDERERELVRSCTAYVGTQMHVVCQLVPETHIP
jgi:hypothetical protein